MAPPSSESKAMYQKDEKALCFHGELLYEAKVLEVRKTDPKDKNSAYEYRVHYKGWKNTWDDWVLQDRLRKLTDDNRELAANLRRELTAAATPKVVPKSTGKTRRGQGSEIGSGRGSEERTSSVPAAGGRGSKRARDNDIEKVGGPHSIKPVKTSASPEPFSFVSPKSPISGTRGNSPGIPLHRNEADNNNAPRQTNRGNKLNKELSTEMKNSTGKDAQNEAAADLSAFIHVPRRAAVKASAALARTAAKSHNSSNSKDDRAFIPSGSFSSKQRHGSSDLAGPARKAGGSRAAKTQDYNEDLDDLLSSEEDTASEATPSPKVPASKKRKVASRSASPAPSRRRSTSSSAPAKPAKPTISAEASRTARKSMPPPARKAKVEPPPAPKAKVEPPPARKAKFEPFAPSWNIKDEDEHTAEEIDDILAKPAPPDSPEYISHTTARTTPGIFFAPLISGTTFEEKHLIEKEAEDANKYKSSYQPKSIATTHEPEYNPNRDLIHKALDGSTKFFPSTGVPDEPLYIDLPGPGNAFDALEFPDRLVELLNGNNTHFGFGWDDQTLARIPNSVLAQLRPDVLAKMPYAALVDRPNYVHERIPESASFWAWNEPGLESRMYAGLSKMKADEQKAIESSRGSASRTLQYMDPARLTITSPINNDNPLFGFDGSGDGAKLSAVEEETQYACRECLRVGSECNGLRPACNWCIFRELECSFNVSQMPQSTSMKQQNSAQTHGNVPDPGARETVANLCPDNLVVTLRARVPNTREITGLDTLALAAEVIESGMAEEEDAYYSRPSIRISVPDHLKNLLVDDWENVTKSLLIVPLPSQAPANYILDEYFDEEKTNRRLGSVEADILEEFIAGLKTYFERAVGKILLYRFERSQLAEVRKLWESGKYKEWEGKGPGDCYGAEHLTRMIVNLPEMIAQTNMDAESVSRLKAELSRFTTWLSRNSARFFCAKYEKPSAEYIESAR